MLSTVFVLTTQLRMSSLKVYYQFMLFRDSLTSVGFQGPLILNIIMSIKHYLFCNPRTVPP